MKKINYKNNKLGSKKIIHEIIMLIRYYKDRCYNIDSKNYCANRLRNFKIKQYLDQLYDDLKLNIQICRYNRSIKQ